jgi:hypothetical protein
MQRDSYDVAVGQILEGADADIRLALRTVLLQNLQLEAGLMVLSEKKGPPQETAPAIEQAGAARLGMR